MDASRLVGFPVAGCALSDFDQISNHCYEAGSVFLNVHDTTILTGSCVRTSSRIGFLVS